MKGFIYVVNFILFQWLFIRLANYDGIYVLVGPTLPLTGWWSNYVHIGQLEFIWIQRWYFDRWWMYTILSCVLWSIIIYFVSLYL